MVEWLEEMVVAPGRQGSSSILLPAMTGNGNDDGRRAQFLAEPGGNLIAVQAGQAEIEQYVIRRLAARDLDGLVSVAGNEDIVAVLFKPHRHGLDGIAVVIDNEDVGHIRPADWR